VARIGVTDLSLEGLDIADQFSFGLEELDTLHRGTLPAILGPVVGYQP
jgi:hypothetical protein